MANIDGPVNTMLAKGMTLLLIFTFFAVPVAMLSEINTIEEEICKEYTEGHTLAYNQCITSSEQLELDILVYEVLDRCTGAWAISYDYRHARCIKLYTEKALADQIWEDEELKKRTSDFHKVHNEYKCR